MKVILNIDDSKAAFFLELLQSFENFVTIETKEDFIKEELTNEHKNILDARLADYEQEPDNFLDWEIVKSEIQQQL